MQIVDVFETIRTDPRLEELIRLLAREVETGPALQTDQRSALQALQTDQRSALQGEQRAVAAEGLWGSSAPILAAVVAERLGRPLLLVTAHADEADDIRDDIETALGRPPELLPQLDTLPQETAAGDELASERLRLCLALMQVTERRSDGATKGRRDGGTEGRRDEERTGATALEQCPPSRAKPSAYVGHGGPTLQSDRQVTPQRGVDLPYLIVAPIMALMQPVPSAEAIRARSYPVAVGQALDPEAVTRWLSTHGFQRCDAVEVPGDFARRGGIIDVFSSAHTDPVRIEFFGDEVSSIRLFDTATQRSSHTLDGVQIPALAFNAAQPAAEARRHGGTKARRHEETEGRRDGEWSDEATKRRSDGGVEERHAEPARLTTSFLSLLPAETIIAFNEPGEIQELGRTYWQRLGERTGIIPADAVFRHAHQFAQLHLLRFTGVLPNAVRFDVTSLPPFEPKSNEALVALGELAKQSEVVVLCDNPPEEQRFRELLAQQAGTGARRHEAEADREGRAKEARRHEGEEETGPHSGPYAPESPSAQLAGTQASGGPEAASASTDADANADASTESARPYVPSCLRPFVPGTIRTAIGVIHRGFQWGRTAYVPHHELFHRYRQRRTLRRVQPARPIDSFFDLEAGDHVVHALHGIGRFVGLKTLDREGRTDEYLALEFADQAVVHVPVSQIHVVQKYIGSFRGRPKLSKVGGLGWKRAKERVAEAVTDLAAELLAVQARRASEEGTAYPHDTDWQREFEGSFLYKETEDQLRALDEIKADMTRSRPMDRLLCGDVGYGKTELAVRAAFKTVEFGKQVAVLVPTTVLAEQHHQTFQERLADYPFSIEVLSRFRTKAEQTRIVARARQGQIDILIGTHRLLSPDVRFSDLGLVVIDEEQRFGVEAKERLKRLRATVDLLTLTATPIPRTLHMAMLGIRDISSLATAPLDRRSIVTQVRMWDDQLVRDAILRELNRDGQVYFVHNFVRDIHPIANHLRTLVPEARFVVGHGQMAGHELEDVMLRFLRREADVLVSTNIIESGLDIPTANTIFINRAERFGLADLHQLRGRVGRSRNRAYAYLLLSPKHPINDHAARRLKAIEHFSELGAGFQIAMRDLEIRGAGNILGAEQSGHIEAVGYEMYCQLLEQAVRRMRNEPAELYRPVNLDLGISATIPRGYIRADRQRMEVYKRLTGCRTIEEIEVLRNDMRDAFGPPPEAVETLIALAEIRVLAQPWGIRSLVLVPPDVVFAIDDLQKTQPLFVDGPGSPRIPDPQTIHWRLPKRYLEPPTLLAILRKQLKREDSSAQRDKPAGNQSVGTMTRSAL